MDNQSTEVAVTECAFAIKESYEQIRRLTRPNYVADPSKFNLWERCAAALLKHRVDPRAYVRFAYRKASTNRKNNDVFVNEIVSAKMIGRYLDDLPNHERELRMILGLQADTVRTETRHGRGLDEILNDKELSLGIVFRYALSHSEGFEELAEQFRECAEFEMSFEPLYKEILSKYLPESTYVA